MEMINIVDVDQKIPQLHQKLLFAQSYLSDILIRAILYGCLPTKNVYEFLSMLIEVAI